MLSAEYILGATGSTYLVDIDPKMNQLVQQPHRIIGMLLAMAASFSSRPCSFHFWAPDVYPGVHSGRHLHCTASKAPR